MTTLVPPIVRPEVENAKSERGEHLVVYASGDPNLLDALRSSGLPCRVYGMRGGPEADQVDGNLEYRPRSGDGFVEDLRTARGVVTGGGFSLLSEAVYLGKPVLSIPLRGQFEQLMNARYLERDRPPRRGSNLDTLARGGVYRHAIVVGRNSADDGLYR